MIAESLPQEILFQIFEYCLLEPCDHDGCLYVKPCTNNHLPLWYVCRMWRISVEPLLFRHFCLDWQNGSSKNHESSHRSNLLGLVFQGRPGLWRHLQRLEIGISSFDDSDVDDLAFATEVVRRGLMRPREIVLRGSCDDWAGDPDPDHGYSHEPETCTSNSFSGPSCILQPFFNGAQFTSPLETIELEACNWPADKLEILMKCPKALQSFKIVPTTQAPLAEKYTSLDLHRVLSHQKHSLESINVRIYGWDGGEEDYWDAGGEEAPGKIIDFRSFHCLKFLTLSQHNVLDANEPEEVATCLATPNLEMLTIDFSPYGDDQDRESGYGLFREMWIDWFKDFIKHRSGIVQNNNFKQIDLVWDFDRSGGAVCIKTAQQQLENGPWPLSAFRQIDENAKGFGVRVGSSGSKEALQRWHGKVQEFLDIYKRGRIAYDFNIPGPHRWIFRGGRRYVYGNRPLPA